MEQKIFIAGDECGNYETFFTLEDAETVISHWIITRLSHGDSLEDLKNCFTLTEGIRKFPKIDFKLKLYSLVGSG